MEFILFIGLVIAVVELKEWRLTKRLEKIQSHLEALNSKFNVVVDKNCEIIDVVNGHSELLNQEIEANSKRNEFLDKAHADLETIVREYKINGVPLGYERKDIERDYHMVEGI